MPPASIPPLTTAIASVNLDRIIRKLPCSSSAVVRFVSTLKRRSSDASKTHRQTLILAISIPIGICILVLVAVTFWLLRSHTRRHGEGWAATSPITAERRSIRPPVFSDAASPPTPSPSRIFDGSALWTHRKITFLYPHPRIQLQGTMFSEEPRIPIVTPHGAPESSMSSLAYGASSSLSSN